MYNGKVTNIICFCNKEQSGKPNTQVRFTKFGSDLPLNKTSALMYTGDTGIFKIHINIVHKHKQYSMYTRS